MGKTTVVGELCILRQADHVLLRRCQVQQTLDNVPRITTSSSSVSWRIWREPRAGSRRMLGQVSNSVGNEQQRLGAPAALLLSKLTSGVSDLYFKVVCMYHVCIKVFGA